MVEQVIADCQAALQANTLECDKRLSTTIAAKDSTIAAKNSVIEQLCKENRELLQKQEQQNASTLVST